MKHWPGMDDLKKVCSIVLSRHTEKWFKEILWGRTFFEKNLGNAPIPAQKSGGSRAWAKKNPGLSAGVNILRRSVHMFCRVERGDTQKVF